MLSNLQEIVYCFLICDIMVMHDILFAMTDKLISAYFSI